MNFSQEEYDRAYRLMYGEEKLKELQKQRREFAEGFPTQPQRPHDVWEIVDGSYDGLGHNHEWEEHKKKGWVFCWICGQEKEWKQETLRGQVFNIAPVAKPRMTRSDKWKKRPAVMKYWAFCDEIKRSGIDVNSGDFITFVVPMPKSWPKKKRKELSGQPHTQTPDLDNFIKALLDAIYADDCHIHTIGARKVWGEVGSISVAASAMVIANSSIKLRQ